MALGFGLSEREHHESAIYWVSHRDPALRLWRAKAFTAERHNWAVGADVDQPVFQGNRRQDDRRSGEARLWRVGGERRIRCGAAAESSKGLYRAEGGGDSADAM